MPDQTMRGPAQPAPRPERRNRRARLRKFLKESSVGVLLALLFFVALLALLNAGFPDATGLGELVRTREATHSVRFDLDLGEEPVDFVATLSNVRKDVRDKPASSVIWGPSSRGKRLGDRHAVQSYADSGATIVFDAANSLELGEKSLIIVRRPRRVQETGRRRAAVLFMNGFVRGSLGTGGDDLELEVLAGGGSIRARPGKEKEADIALSLDRDTSTLAVHEGIAEVVWGDETTTVPAGHMVTFDAETAPKPPVRLPGKPVLVSPDSGASYRYRDAPPRVTFSWRPIDDATDFRVQIAQDAAFTKTVYDERHSDTSLVHGNLPAGRYYWRVLAMRGPIESAASDARELVVGQDEQPPRLTVDLATSPVTDPTVVIRGSTEPGCRIFIGEESVPTDAEGRFEHELALRNGYNFIVIQSIDASGNTAFESHTIVARLEHSEKTP